MRTGGGLLFQITEGLEGLYAFLRQLGCPASACVLTRLQAVSDLMRFAQGRFQDRVILSRELFVRVIYVVRFGRVLPLFVSQAPSQSMYFLFTHELTATRHHDNSST